MARTVRRPTEDAALARITAWERTQPSSVSVCNHTREIMDVDGIMYLTWFFHTKLDLGVSTLWDRWLKDWGDVPTFMQFLRLYGIVYRVQKIS